MRGSRAESGFTLVEVLLSLSVLAISFLALGSSVIGGIKSTIDLEERGAVRNQALRYVERIDRLPFGEPGDPAPAAADLEALFDDRVEVPRLTLHQLRTPVDQDGRVFAVAGFEAEGEFEVRVNEDANGNGVVDAEEAAGDLLRIEVFFAGRPVLRTFRAMPAAAE